MRQTLRIAWAYLKTRKRQSLVSIMGVAMGVGFFIAISSMMMGFQNFFVDRIIDISPHIIIKDEYRNARTQPAEVEYPQSAIKIHGVKPKEELRGIKNPMFVVDWVSDNVRNVNVAPVLFGQIFLRFGGKDIGSTVIGIDPVRERKVTNLEKDMVQGKLNHLLTESNGIIIGTGMAKRLGVRMGNKVNVVSPAGVQMVMKIVGLFETGITNIDYETSYVLIKKAQVLQQKLNRVNQIRIRADNVERAEPLARMIEERFAYRTESWRETNNNIFSIFVVQNVIMYSTVGAILIVAGFGIFNIISTIIYEKNRDIGILKSIGFQERDIQHIFMYQGLIVGLIGAVVGWIVGYSLVSMLKAWDIALEGEIKTEGFPLYHSIMQYVLATVFAIISSVISAWIPARKAARLKPVDIIRGAY